ncbi:MAG: hypothetical protein CL670_04315 [Balneola sp.]|jgi:hypothetical protein|uniref:hypothetical protein n=1 Tax=Gracilimonas sp. TaxID=1974203 RepID=UPI000C4CC043|nr:hypothetical protein [Gracilimonas sp.]MAL19376.1 hypothetical protein [Balneola sp.]MBE78355.1 hypothetical protein [Balneola sp.]HBX67027.1 hypothetical protein [Balneolaceae bacterium]|tara:strand:- start:850 stop:1140 length:291 start_codon:yes stop_codon:yes gene_type:complete
MWLDYIWNIPLFWWFLLAAFILFIVVSFIRRKLEKDPLKIQMEHFCRCYARGEISLDDFKELKHDLQEFEKHIKTTNIRKPIPRVKARKNKKQLIR